MAGYVPKEPVGPPPATLLDDVANLAQRTTPDFPGYLTMGDTQIVPLPRPYPGHPENLLLMDTLLPLRTVVHRRYTVPADLPWLQRLWIWLVVKVVGV